MNKKLTAKIDKFIKDKRKGNGGFAEVKENDLSDLSSIIMDLIESKYQSDPDGDYPINFELVNRHIHENSYIVKVPYSHKDLNGHFKSLITNINYFTGRLDRITRGNDTEIKRKEA